MITQIFAAAVGTIAFSILFSVPRKYYPYCGVIGACGWLVYLLAERMGAVAASMVATMVVVFLSRYIAICIKCPVTIFLIPGIFPLVPGSYVYWTAYYLVTNEVWEAAQKGYMAVKIALAIVLGIVFVFEIPQKFFAVLNRLFTRVK